jgi:hypothetical protein
VGQLSTTVRSKVHRCEVVDRLRREQHRGVSLAPRFQALLHVVAKRRMLDEPPCLVHDAQLERGGFGRILDTGRDAMQHVEEQRLQDYRKVRIASKSNT